MKGRYTRLKTSLINSYSEMDKWGLAFGILVGIIFAIILIFCFHLSLKWMLPVLNSNAFGALLGALLTGFAALLIQWKEKKREASEKEDEIGKIKFKIQYYGNDLNALSDKMEKEIKMMDFIDSPFDEIEPYEDDDGITRFANVPPNEVFNQYYEKISPYRERISKYLVAMNEIIDKILLVDVEMLDLRRYKQIINFKNDASKIMRPIMEENSKKNSNLTSDDFVDIKSLISQLNELIR